MTTSARRVTLLTRAGCGACEEALRVLRPVCEEFGAECDVVDVDVAADHAPDLRAEYGDRLPVVLVDGREHSYWDVDVPRLRRDLGA